MERLRQILTRIDGKGYKAYKDIQGEYRFPQFQLFIDYVQGDPFALPSRLRVRMPQNRAGYQPEWYRLAHHRTALEDWLTRKWVQKIDQLSRRARGSGKSGLISVDRPGQEILKRTSVVVNGNFAEVRLTVGLPAQGRRILGRQAQQMLLKDLPELVEQSLLLTDSDCVSVEKRMKLADNQLAIRQVMRERGWIAFVADGSILPRESGISDRPLQTNEVVRFQSPPTLRETVAVPHGPAVTGMAIPDGITLIIGGGYHGKSTLLHAIERGVYDHIERDGREYVLTDPEAVKIRAEDGRRVEKVNISPFINNLPFGRDTKSFSTEDASGSTSQAANIMENLELGCSCLLIDEDTSATNFMIRDARMQALVSKGKEPITPFIDKVRQLYEEKNVSSILVLGGSGDYFDVADRVIMMDHYLPYDVTEKAKQVARVHSQRREPEGGDYFGEITPRRPLAKGFDAQKGKKEKVDAKGLHTILFGRVQLDCSALEQLTDPSQTRAIAQMLRELGKRANGERTLTQLVEDLYLQIGEHGLDIISPFYGQHPGDLAMPRKFELAGALNRLRSLVVK
ncbi:ABC-ATPase domain-containing protein [Paenactinomyces guangxiensis]|uniref:ABC-ATPase domain-containing protein n=1 Tax=Paenactinomyces guangxiensis TaxID=1490290 RepID=A0A7W1WNZ6_9BACL|nr:ABC-ATPase domain-containing protein [Paenactinomyces guangxiensis]MBA4493418.1 ABC-ATPase domain-containing protein [Paenactinomyces guangxiensis]MBH8590509.1 ABC-ATPase domain-containing protein [Paenactinomyces guangxiensis]